MTTLVLRCPCSVRTDRHAGMHFDDQCSLVAPGEQCARCRRDYDQVMSEVSKLIGRMEAKREPRDLFPNWVRLLLLCLLSTAIVVLAIYLKGKP